MKKRTVLMLAAMAMTLSACVVPYYDGHDYGRGHGHYKKQGHHGLPGNSAYGHSQGNGRGPHH